ncbi:MAG: hypothetical protein Q7S27_01780 [Nanoarchaeota archaeon]|nr:hypothetical protein [Nanoarchaeota archaeon]
MECDLSSLDDLTLVSKYNEGLDVCSVILFQRHQDYLDTLAKNTVYLRFSDDEDKKSISYYTFAKSFARYTAYNGASFKTYIKRCVRNALLSEHRREHAEKREGDLHSLSLDSEFIKDKVEDKIYRLWKKKNLLTSQIL